MFKYSAILLAYFCVTNGQVIVSEQCPDLPVQRYFDLEKFLGKWYERMVYTTGPGGDRCNLDTLQSNDSSSFNLSMTDLSDWVVSGDARPTSKESAKFVMRFRVGANSDLPYWILKTDYNSYAVAWTCLDIPYASLRYAWVLTRDRISSKELHAALSVFEELRIDQSYLKKVIQSECPN